MIRQIDVTPASGSLSNRQRRREYEWRHQLGLSQRTLDVADPIFSGLPSEQQPLSRRRSHAQNRQLKLRRRRSETRWFLLIVRALIGHTLFPSNANWLIMTSPSNEVVLVFKPLVNWCDKVAFLHYAPNLIKNQFLLTNDFLHFLNKCFISTCTYWSVSYTIFFILMESYRCSVQSVGSVAMTAKTLGVVGSCPTALTEVEQSRRRDNPKSDFPKQKGDLYIFPSAFRFTINNFSGFLINV